MAVWAVRRAYFLDRGRRTWEVVQVSDGKIEFYCVTDPTDGIPMFVGYLNSPSLTGWLRARGVEALVGKPPVRVHREARP